MPTDLRNEIYKLDAVLSNLVKKIEQSESITKRNKELILEFRNSGLSRGLSKSRIQIQLNSLFRVAAVARVDFDKAIRKDIEEIMARIESDSRYSGWTRETAKAVLKSFYRWLYKLQPKDPLPDCVRWIQIRKLPTKITKQDLVTKEEIARMVSTTTDIMQKAALSVLFESCARPGEFLSMRLNDATFYENYCIIRVRGKMENKLGDNEIYLLQSYDILRTWIESHPSKGKLDAPLWCVTSYMKDRRTKEDIHGKVITLTYLNKIIKQSARRAGINKRVYAYLMRHSRGTALYKEIGEALAKKQMGHSPDTKCSKVYNHLAGEDVLDGLKRANGLPVTKENGDDHKEVCPRCHHVNSYGATKCSKCSLFLTVRDIEETIKQKEREERMHQRLEKFAELLDRNPRLLELIDKGLAESGQVAAN